MIGFLRWLCVLVVFFVMGCGSEDVLDIDQLTNRHNVLIYRNVSKSLMDQLSNNPQLGQVKRFHIDAKTTCRSLGFLILHSPKTLVLGSYYMETWIKQKQDGFIASCQDAMIIAEGQKGSLNQALVFRD